MPVVGWGSLTGSVFSRALGFCFTAQPSGSKVPEVKRVPKPMARLCNRAKPRSRPSLSVILVDLMHRGPRRGWAAPERPFP